MRAVRCSMLCVGDSLVAVAPGGGMLCVGDSLVAVARGGMLCVGDSLVAVAPGGGIILRAGVTGFRSFPDCYWWGTAANERSPPGCDAGAQSADSTTAQTFKT